MPEKLKFYDLTAKKAFETDSYEILEKDTIKGKMKIAIAVSPYTGKKCARPLGKA